MNEKELLNVIEQAKQENWEKLVLEELEIEYLPPEIGQLQNLSTLDIGSSQLTSLPAEIGQLHNLSALIINDSQLVSLPAEVGQLSSLEALVLANNEIEYLPSSLLQCKHLNLLILYRNPLPIPVEILAKASLPKAILDAYFQQCTPLHELKLLLLGQSTVGKTSVVERLLYDQPPSDSGKTIGLDIHPWRVPVETAAQTADIAVNLWDFGGQEIYHATHQFFLSHRSLYLLVVDARQDDDANRLAYWLQLIQSFGGDSPIILVVNKIDQGMRRVAERDLREKYPQLKQVVYTSCTTGEGIDDLRQALRHTMGDMEHLREQIPQTWMAVKEKLAGMTADYITYEQFARMCAEAEIQQAGTQAVLARLLHDLGAALNYADESSLAGTYILQPDWVTYGIYQIVTEPRLQANGILPESMLTEILDAGRYPFHKHHILLKMMERFELCHPMEDGHRRLIPTLLPPDRSGFDWPENDQPRFQLRYGVLPPSIIARLMVRLHTHTWQDTRWRDGVVLARHGARARVQADRAEEQINIWLKGDADARRTLLTLIRAQLDEIHASFARLEVEEWVPLPGHPGQAFKYNGLLRLLERGIDTHWDPNTDVQFQVMPLLDSLETPADRLGRRLASQLTKQSMSELKAMTDLDLGIDPESLSHERKTDFVRELIGHCQRRGMLGQLEQFARRRA